MTMQAVVGILVLLCSASCSFAKLHELRGAHRSGSVTSISSDLLSRCKEEWFTTNLDHFSRSSGPGGVETFNLRYFVCSENHRAGTQDSPPGPIFFYVGNEADVLLYLNATGLMWENAEKFGALLIFAEHRYYGKSLPFGDDTYNHLEWLASEQALGDYATLLRDFKARNSLENAPVIGFGGSYGGMLGTWARLKYPHVWQGVIAGSAPIWAYVGENPPMDPGFYAKGVTYDTTPAAGAAPGCTDTLRSAFAAIIELGSAGSTGLDTVNAAMGICPSSRVNTTDDAYQLREWAGSAFDSMAMGNYPFASGYMLNGHGELPPFPMRVACSALMDTVTGEEAHALSPPGPLPRRLFARQDDLMPCDGGPCTEFPGEKLLEGLAAAVGVWYNNSGNLDCFDPFEGVNEDTDRVGDLWDYQWCTEQFMPSSQDGVTDVFWPDRWNETAAVEGCIQTWGKAPRPLWATTEWGGRNLETLTNVVFSNGLYDPWHGGGVLEDLSETVKAVIIPDGAHHLDLMFSHPDDPDSVKEARAIEVAEIQRWIDEYHRPS